MNISTSIEAGRDYDVELAFKSKHRFHWVKLESDLQKAMLVVDKPKVKSKIVHVDRMKHHNFTRVGKRVDVLRAVSVEQHATTWGIADVLNISQPTSAARLKRMAVSGDLWCSRENVDGYRRQTLFYHVTEQGFDFLDGFEFIDGRNE